MLSARLVTLIEDHAEDLTRRVLGDLATNPRTPAYHRIPQDELHQRVYDVYGNLGRWLSDKSDQAIEPSYVSLGQRRRAEGVPLSEVVYALMVTKQQLHGFIRSSGLVDSAVELYQEEELNLMVDHFFDRVIYYTVRGYEQAAAASGPAIAAASR